MDVGRQAIAHKACVMFGWSHEEATKAADCGYAAVHWHARGRLPASVSTWTPSRHAQLHQFEHLLDDMVVTLKSPRVSWNYINENTIGRVVAVVTRTHWLAVARRLLQR